MLSQTHDTDLAEVVTPQQGLYVVHTNPSVVLRPLHRTLNYLNRIVNRERVRLEALLNKVSPFVSLLPMIIPGRLLTMPLTLTAVFGAIIGSMAAFMPYLVTPANPFAEYADVFPGQSSKGIDHHAFQCAIQPYGAYHAPADQPVNSETLCILNPASGAFTRVSVVYSMGVIHSLSFQVRDASLTIGDLAELMDVSVRPFRRSVLFVWHGYVGIAQPATLAARYSVLRRLALITFTDTPMTAP